MLPSLVSNSSRLDDQVLFFVDDLVFSGRFVLFVDHVIFMRAVYVDKFWF